MKNNMKSQSKKKTPICIGTGLVALDVVINGNPIVPLKIYAGGSCGNVLAILSYFNWESFPIARLKLNDASKKLLSDLDKWNVNPALITQTPEGSTPIIIHRIKKDKNGNSIHKFQFRNPENGDWLPSYKPILRKDVISIIQISPIPSVFYFDRVNSSSIILAKYFKEKGALIFFEPSSIKDIKLFEKCLEIADIIKFSNDRIKNYSNLFPNQRVPLEIETFGKNGLRYRFDHEMKTVNWAFVSSYNISFVVDAAGSGDWFSAGIISKIARSGAKGFKNCSNDVILRALKYGQALGAINCFFDGARGLMYELKSDQIESIVRKMQNNKSPITLINRKVNYRSLRNVKISSLYS